MADSLTVTLKRPLALAHLVEAARRAFRDLVGIEAAIDARSEAGATELGTTEDEVRLNVGGAEVMLTVYSLPDHHCIPEELAAFWAVIAPGGSAAMAGAAAVALGLAREVGASIVDGGARWTRTRELDAAGFEAALRLPDELRGTEGSLAQFAPGSPRPEPTADASEPLSLSKERGYHPPVLKFTLGRDAIINYIGFRHAFPVVHKQTGEPWILRPGDDESQYRRVGWYEFFRAAEARNYVFVYDDSPDSFEWRWSTPEAAMKELGPKGSELYGHVQQVLKGIKLEAPPAQPPQG